MPVIKEGDIEDHDNGNKNYDKRMTKHRIVRKRSRPNFFPSSAAMSLLPAFAYLLIYCSLLSGVEAGIQAAYADCFPSS